MFNTHGFSKVDGKSSLILLPNLMSFKLLMGEVKASNIKFNNYEQIRDFQAYYKYSGVLKYGDAAWSLKNE